MTGGRARGRGGRRARVRRGGAAALLLAAAASLLLPACFVSPREQGEWVEVSLALDLPPVAVAGLATDELWDSQGLFHLEAFPKLVRVAVETADYELTHATWPDPEQGVGAGEDDDGAVGVELRVPAGGARRITALGFWAEAGQVTIFREAQPAALALEAGQVVELDLQMVRHETGQLELVVGCDGPSLWEPQTVAVADARAMVLFPRVELEGQPASSALTARLTGVPVQRPLWARVYLRHIATGVVKTLDWRKPTFGVEAAGQSSAVNLSLPCALLE